MYHKRGQSEKYATGLKYPIFDDITSSKVLYTEKWPLTREHPTSVETNGLDNAVTRDTLKLTSESTNYVLL